MAVIVDKARRDDLAAGIDGLAGRPGELAELGDLAVLDPDIAVERRHPRAVDNPAILDQQVIRHRCPSSIALCGLLLLVADYSAGMPRTASKFARGGHAVPRPSGEGAARRQSRARERDKKSRSKSLLLFDL